MTTWHWGQLFHEEIPPQQLPADYVVFTQNKLWRAYRKGKQVNGGHIDVDYFELAHRLQICLGYGPIYSQQQDGKMYCKVDLYLIERNPEKMARGESATCYDFDPIPQL